MKIDDYTRLPIGTKIDNGEIQTCPHCGKLGLLEEVDGKKWFTHSQARGFNSKGSPQISWDMCPKLDIILRTTPE
jgi:hypothetical protein